MATSRPSRLWFALAIGLVACSVPKPNFNDGSPRGDSGCADGGCGEASGIESVSVGAQHTCVAYDDGSVRCFGNPEHGRLGALVDEVPFEETYRPLEVVEFVLGDLQPLTDTSRLVSRDLTTCGMRADGRAVCWGDAEIFVSGLSGQTATPIRDERGEASPTRIALGTRISLILTDGVARSAGSLASLGRPEATEGVFAPVAGIPAGVSVRAIATHGPSNDEAAVLVAANGDVFCWGGTSVHLCGDTEGDGESARPLAGLTSITEVCMGVRHACASNGSDVFCWGDGADGRLGTSASELQATPTMVPNSWGSPIEHIVCSDHSTLLIADGGQELWGWGRNNSGELGVGHQEPVPSPRRLLEVGATETLEVAANGHVCILRHSSAGDEVLCAGSNRSGQQGRPRSGSTTLEFTPVPGLL